MEQGGELRRSVYPFREKPPDCGNKTTAGARALAVEKLLETEC
jgi:hypothetical protein